MLYLPSFHTDWWVVGKTPPRPSHTRLLEPRTPVHDDGGRARDAPLVLHERSDGDISGTWTYWR